MPDARSRATLDTRSVRAAADADGLAEEFWGEPARRAGPRPAARPAATEVALDRLRRAAGDARVAAAVLLTIAVAAGVVWYRAATGGGGLPAAGPGAPVAASTSAPSDVVADTVPTPGAAPDVATTAPSGASVRHGRVLVHVAGAVVHPGVVDLPAGSRAVDALEAAGGGLPEADLDRLNLAAKVVDGQRILVQRVGDPTAPADPAVGGVPTATGPLNLNAATPAQLEELPGIGPALAAAIVAERDRRGGFRSVNELRDVRGIGEQRFADLKDLVTV